MNASSADLLRRLAPPPGGVGSAASTAPVQKPPAAAQQVASGDFEALLKQARAGAIGSGLGVEVDPASGVTLENSQLARVAEAADRAQAAGIGTALVVIDGQAFVLDVDSRTITAQADLAAPVAGIDGLVVVPSVGVEAGGGGASAVKFGTPTAPGIGLGGLSAVPQNPSLAALLAAPTPGQTVRPSGT